MGKQLKVLTALKVFDHEIWRMYVAEPIVFSVIIGPIEKRNLLLIFPFKLASLIYFLMYRTSSATTVARTKDCFSP